MTLTIFYKRGAGESTGKIKLSPCERMWKEKNATNVGYGGLQFWMSLAKFETECAKDLDQLWIEKYFPEFL